MTMLDRNKVTRRPRSARGSSATLRSPLTTPSPESSLTTEVMGPGAAVDRCGGDQSGQIRVEVAQLVGPGEGDLQLVRGELRLRGDECLRRFRLVSGSARLVHELVDLAVVVSRPVEDPALVRREHEQRGVADDAGSLQVPESGDEVDTFTSGRIVEHRSHVRGLELVDLDGQSD